MRILLKPGSWFKTDTCKSTTGALDITHLVSGQTKSFAVTDWVAGTGVSTITVPIPGGCSNSPIIQLQDSLNNIVTIDEVTIDGDITLQVVTGDEFAGKLTIK